MVGLGFLAYGIPGIVNGAGLRFTIYAVPVMALGVGFLIYEVSKYISSQIKGTKNSRAFRYFFITLLTLGVLYPNITHIQDYRVPTVFNKKEVEVLDKLKDIANEEDYVVAWWDYGYPIRYYSDVKTLIDGGKHTGDVNFPVSYILNSTQKEAANMARLDVEYTEKRFNAIKNNIKMAPNNVEQMSLDYGYKDVNDFLLTLDYDIRLPQKTRDIYLYLPNRMLSIFPTVTLFSNIDLMSGKQKKRPFFFVSTNFKEDNENIYLGQGVKLIKNKAQIQLGNNLLNANNFVVTEYDSKGALKTNIQAIDKNAHLSIIYMKNYNQFLIVDKEMYNSTFIQLFVLENYNKSLFEPVILTPYSKVYKVKI
jgi:dolichyl-diphosphooligosaccharide--protein glycosyltransferase/undecaprenyl-diphosphooligosaccharide--protein glycosyltransferase